MTIFTVVFDYAGSPDMCILGTFSTRKIAEESAVTKVNNDYEMDYKTFVELENDFMDEYCTYISIVEQELDGITDWSN